MRTPVTTGVQSKDEFMIHSTRPIYSGQIPSKVAIQSRALCSCHSEASWKAAPSCLGRQ
jgi:hypothetical protein